MGVNNTGPGVSIACDPLPATTILMSLDRTDYAALAGQLDSAGSSLSPAELHGSLCGAFAAGGEEAGLAWLRQCIAELDDEPDTLAALDAELESLGAMSWRALAGLGFEFRLLLPDDETNIDLRATALGLWCHGFLAGLVVGGFDVQGTGRERSQELDEIVGDFAEISRVGVDEEEDRAGEASERSLVELSEYVRVAAQIVFEELGQAPGRQDRTIH